MKPDATVVIVGAGQGGVQVAASLRERGHAGPVVLVGDEPGLPYQRPPLSKRFLLHPQTPIELRPQSFYERRHIELRHTRVTSIDRSARRVRLADGDTLAYDHVVLAMGARNRIPPIDGITLNGIVQVRTQDDAERLRTRLQAASHLAIIGAGFIGMEVAAAAAKTGIATTVIEALHRPMARAVSVATSTHMADLHRAQGTTLRLGRTVVRLDGDRTGAVTGVRLDDGSLVPADLVVVGVGVSPAVELATEAGIDVGDGIRVDAFLRTSDPHISAIGDCAEFPSVHTRARTRLESVQNAVDQARCLAACLTGAPTPYNAVPWFWTEQFSTKLQISRPRTRPGREHHPRRSGDRIVLRPAVQGRTPRRGGVRQRPCGPHRGPPHSGLRQVSASRGDGRRRILAPPMGRPTLPEPGPNRGSARFGRRPCRPHRRYPLSETGGAPPQTPSAGPLPRNPRARRGGIDNTCRPPNPLRGAAAENPQRNARSP